jgi:uncharacterized protein (TIGR02231 family)
MEQLKKKVAQQYVGTVEAVHKAKFEQLDKIAKIEKPIKRKVGLFDDDDIFGGDKPVEEDDLQPLDESAEKEYHSLELNSCKIVGVSVYQNNAALVTRKTKVTIKDMDKEQIIRFTQFSKFVNGDSVRVAGKGDCVIADVSYISTTKKVEHDQINRKKIEIVISELDDKKKALVAARTRLQKERQFLKNYQQGVVRVSQMDPNVSNLMDLENTEAMSNFMRYSTEHFERVEYEIFVLDNLISDLDKQKQKQDKLLREEKPEFTTEPVRDVVVTLSSNQQGEVELEVSYIITNASWKPIYDVRVNSSEKKLELTYYGIITQSTEEDWIDTAVSLSTAEPNTSASPPPLQRMNLYLVYPQAPRSFAAKSSRARKSDMRAKEMLYDECDDYEQTESLDMIQDMVSLSRSAIPEKKAVSVVETTSEQGAISTVFHIPRNTSIPSDGAPHKVTITTLTFDVELSYSTVPKLDTNAYLKVKTMNTSNYPFLPGDMNVFVDNNFVSQGTVPACNPNEEFSNYLGGDPSVRIQYATPKKFTESIGLLKSNSKVSVERKTTVKNTKPTEVTITIEDQVPYSDDEKVKVNITNPKITQPADKGKEVVLKNVKISDTIVASTVKLNKSQNIEWTLTIPPTTEVIIDLNYNVSWPTSTYINVDSL